jgi:hypothetical protein
MMPFFWGRLQMNMHSIMTQACLKILLELTFSFILIYLVVILLDYVIYKTLL